MANLTEKEREEILKEIEQLNFRIDRCIEYKNSNAPYSTYSMKDEWRIQMSIYMEIKNYLKSVIIQNKFLTK